MRLLSALLVLTVFSGCRTTAQSLEDVFADVRGSVVTLRTSSKTILPTAPARPAAIQGVGSGVLCSAEGDILTAAHVVQTADEVLVQFRDGSTRTAEVVASEPSADVALLRMRGSIPDGVRAAPLGDSDVVRVGQRVMVVGAPRGISHTLTVGHISARRLDRGGFASLGPTEFFQTDAAINQGNSGGPMFSMDGEVIGIVSHIVSESGGSEGLGFAVTSNVTRRLLLEERSFWTGIDGLFLDGELARALNVPDGQSGFLVQHVARGSPGEAVGLRAGELPATIAGQELLLGGDVVLEVLGLEVGGPRANEIREALNRIGPGDRLELKVLRQGRYVELEAQLGS